MKKIIYIFTFLLLSTSGMYGQNITHGYGANLDFYVGTWRYTNTSTKEEFTIKLRKSVYTAYNTRKDCVVGAYTYKKNGVVILDNMDKFTNNRSPGNSVPIYASNAKANISDSNPNELYLSVRDYGLVSDGVPKYGIGNITINSTGNPKKIRWVLEDPEGVYIKGDWLPGFTIPTDIILTKIE